jgi:hypothetical protein
VQYVLVASLCDDGLFLKVRVHSFYGDKMDGAGRPVFAVKLGVFAAHALLALINVIFFTSIGGFP